MEPENYLQETAETAEARYLQRLGNVAGVTPEQQMLFLKEEYPRLITQLFESVRKISNDDEFLAKLLLVSVLQVFCEDGYQILDKFMEKYSAFVCAELIQLVHLFRNIEGMSPEERVQHLKSAFLVEGFRLPAGVFDTPQEG